MPPIDEPTLLAAEPQIYVANVETAAAFYVGTLGFELVFSHGEPPFYAQVARGAARLNLRFVDGPVYAEDCRARNTDLLAAVITVGGIAALFSAYEAAGAKFHQQPRREPWGSNTFIVRDPDGNLIAFAGD